MRSTLLVRAGLPKPRHQLAELLGQAHEALRGHPRLRRRIEEVVDDGQVGRQPYVVAPFEPGEGAGVDAGRSRNLRSARARALPQLAEAPAHVGLAGELGHAWKSCSKRSGRAGPRL
jgi:hypothetical protein